MHPYSQHGADDSRRLKVAMSRGAIEMHIAGDMPRRPRAMNSSARSRGGKLERGRAWCNILIGRVPLTGRIPPDHARGACVQGRGSGPMAGNAVLA